MCDLEHVTVLQKKSRAQNYGADLAIFQEASRKHPGSSQPKSETRPTELVSETAIEPANRYDLDIHNIDAAQISAMCFGHFTQTTDK